MPLNPNEILINHVAPSVRYYMQELSDMAKQTEKVLNDLIEQIKKELNDTTKQTETKSNPKNLVLPPYSLSLVLISQLLILIRSIKKKINLPDPIKSDAVSDIAHSVTSADISELPITASEFNRFKNIILGNEFPDINAQFIRFKNFSKSIIYILETLDIFLEKPEEEKIKLVIFNEKIENYENFSDFIVNFNNQNKYLLKFSFPILSQLLDILLQKINSDWKDRPDKTISILLQIRNKIFNSIEKDNPYNRLIEIEKRITEIADLNYKSHKTTQTILYISKNISLINNFIDTWSATESPPQSTDIPSNFIIIYNSLNMLREAVQIRDMINSDQSKEFLSFIEHVFQETQHAHESFEKNKNMVLDKINLVHYLFLKNSSFFMTTFHFYYNILNLKKCMQHIDHSIFTIKTLILQDINGKPVKKSSHLATTFNDLTNTPQQSRLQKPPPLRGSSLDV